MRKAQSPEFQLLLVSLIWGMNFVAMKFLLAEISPVNLILFRFIAGSLLLFLLLLFFEDVKIPPGDILKLTVIGALGITVYQFFFTYALKLAPVVNVSIIINTAPLYGGLLSALLGYEPFRKKRLFAVVVGFAGIFILITKGSFVLQGGELKGNVLALISSVLWALYTVLSKPFLERHSPLKVTTYSMITGSLLLCPFLPFYFSLAEFQALSLTGWGFLVFAIVFSVVVAFFLWYRGVSRIGPTRAIMFQYAVPVFAALFAVLFLKEQLHVAQFIGAALVFVSLHLARKT